MLLQQFCCYSRELTKDVTDLKMNLYLVPKNLINMFFLLDILAGYICLTRKHLPHTLYFLESLFFLDDHIRNGHVSVCVQGICGFCLQDIKSALCFIPSRAGSTDCFRASHFSVEFGCQEPSLSI